MSDKTKLSIFPKNRLSELTMLYLQNQNLSDLTPEQLLDKYDEVYDSIRTHYECTRENRRRIIWNEA